MKRFFSIFLMAFWAFSVLRAAVVTFDFSTAEGITAMGYAVPAQSSATNLTQAGPVTVSGVTLSATDGSTETRIWNSQGNYTLRIYVDGSITLSVAEGSITGITVNAANTTNFDLIASVGDYSAAGSVGTWSGNASSVTLTHVGSKNAQVSTLVVTTSADDPGDDPVDPIDPNIEKLDSLHHLAAMADGTEFQFTSDVYVNYQWENYLWVMQLDSEGNALAGLIYGDTGKEYRLGSVIPAGWTGKKTTYKGLVEITNPAYFKNAKNILDEDYYSPFDVTGYLGYIANPDEGWENYKVYLEGVHLSTVDDRGNFTISSSETDDDGNHVDAVMAGYNKFGIDYPDVDPTEVYAIQGMVTIYNGNMQLYPISIAGDPGTRLWKVLYEGEDGGQYKLNDTLYVAATVDCEKGKFIFVTDNVDEIYYDTYAEWGYAEWMDWYPDWIALDCSDDEQLYSTVSDMQVLAPGTVKGALADRLTNPRLVLNSTPVELEDAQLPTLTLFQYDLSKDYLAALGHEVGRADGYFFYRDGVPYLCSEQDTVVVKLDFDFAPALEAEMSASEGMKFGLLCIFTLDEPWEENQDNAPARRIHATDVDYFTNYTIHPLAILSCSAVDEVIADRQVVDVKYVTPSGIISQQPQDGVNIVVKTLSDGSRTTVKRLNK
ncbi:MAG: hypothetical protein IJV05_07445 [Muribaculaceae bacterium]|nr:hypothetical protein [Muribaculaceae bacterium]